ncbi:MAG: cobalamin biosynthesis protein [Pseudomonadota bacterium]
MDLTDIGGSDIALNALSASLLIGFAALLLEVVISYLPGFSRLRWHQLLAGPCAGLSRKLNRRKRSPNARLIRGLLVTVILVVPALLMGTVVTGIIINLPRGFDGLVVLLLLAASFRLGFYWQIARATRQAINVDNRKVSHHLLRQHTVGDTAALDDHGLIRRSMELLVRGWDRGLVAPLFWFLIFGLPGLFTVIVVQAAAEAARQTDFSGASFGLVIDRLDAIMLAIPTRLAGFCLLITIALLRPKRLGPSWQAIKSGRRLKQPDNGRWVLGPIAGALDIALLGPTPEEPKRRWIGDGTAQLEIHGIHQAGILLAISGVILALIMTLSFIGALSAGI